MQQLCRRSLLVSGAGLAVTACATTSAPVSPDPVGLRGPVEPIQISTEPMSRVAPPLDPQGLIPADLRERALIALDQHAASLPHRDRIYIVNFSSHSAQPRMFELDVVSGEARAFHTAHGVGSDPFHSGFAIGFSNMQDSNASSVGAYRTAGENWGMRHGDNVLLDGLDNTNSNVRDRAIIVHAADYCEPEWLEREGKLGRSFGCFAVSRANLTDLRPRMAEGRLLYAGIVL